MEMAVGSAPVMVLPSAPMAMTPSPPVTVTPGLIVRFAPPMAKIPKGEIVVLSPTVTAPPVRVTVPPSA